MFRRIHVSRFGPDEVRLSSAEAHHARDVLRLAEGATVELFDDAGRVAEAVIKSIGPQGMTLKIAAITDTIADRFHLTVAAAIPKGDRADWMVEKLSELGVQGFIPLITARSVVVPAGKNKLDRWTRLAIESAKQSRRVGVMCIHGVTPLHEVIGNSSPGWYLSTRPDTPAIIDMIERNRALTALTLFIGPEGGWAEDEIAAFGTARFSGVGLTRTILRVETAAIAAAAVVACTAERDRRI